MPIDLTNGPLPPPDRYWKGIPIWHVTVKGPPEKFQGLIRIYRTDEHWVYIKVLHFWWLQFQHNMEMMTSHILGKHHATR